MNVYGYIFHGNLEICEENWFCVILGEGSIIYVLPANEN